MSISCFSNLRSNPLQRFLNDCGGFNAGLVIVQTQDNVMDSRILWQEAEQSRESCTAQRKVNIHIRLRRKKAVLSNTVNSGTLPDIFNQIFAFPRSTANPKPISAAYEISSDAFPIVGFAFLL